LYHHFQNLRSYRPTRFEVDLEGFDVEIGGQEDHREEKIDLPPGWLRGFMQIQSAMSLPMRRVPLSREAAYSLLAFLRRNKAKKSPRAIRWILEDGAPPRLVLEPWGVEIVSHGTRYEGPGGEPVRTWGRDRVLALARTLPLAERVDVFLLGTGLPSFWVARMGEMRLTLGLSGWTSNDWSSGSALDHFLPPSDPGVAVIDSASAFVRGKGIASLEEIASASGTGMAESAAAMNHLARTGQAIYDLEAGGYRWRQIMPRAVGESDIGGENPEVAASRGIQVSDIRREDAPKGGTVYIAKISGNGGDPSEILLDADGVVRRGRCGCSHHFKFEIRKGLCRHLIALRNAAQGYGDHEGKALSANAWFERMRQWAGK
jgi:hypothetical protein